MKRFLKSLNCRLHFLSLFLCQVRLVCPDPRYRMLLAPVDYRDRICHNSTTHHFPTSCSRLPFVSLTSLLRRVLPRWPILISFNVSRGYTGAGGLEENGLYINCTGGAARHVDISLFGNDHIYQRPTPRKIYDTTLSFDPEGLFLLL